jgi:glycine/D-amino acid oxidase-like deaminating enzyme
MPSPWPSATPSPAHRLAYGDSTLAPFWPETVAARDTLAPLAGHGHSADLAIIGGGFTGLWAALHAKELNPERRVVILEATRCGDGASSRNGGFLATSLTHGLSNGLARFPDEMPVLERLGAENFAGLAADLQRYGIDAEYERSGELDVAVDPALVDDLAEAAELARGFGHDVVLLDRDAVRAEIHSPTYQAGLWDRGGVALVNPSKLVEGLLTAARGLGVELHEYSPARRLVTSAGAASVTVVTDAGTLEADRVLLATSAYPGLLRRLGLYVAPVYDYVLVSEPLSGTQRSSLGWARRQGVGDTGNQFHYYRLTADDRILWGGYDAVYRYGGPVGAHLDDDEATFARLSQNFFHTFPQLEGLNFSHRWGGAIDTCSRFSVFFGTARGGRVAYALGYTGLGVGASRWGGRTALDRLDGRVTEATALSAVRSKPVPFPPEPLRAAVIALTRNRLAAADADGGRRGLWLRTLDRAGLGFDS